MLTDKKNFREQKIKVSHYWNCSFLEEKIISTATMEMTLNLGTWYLFIKGIWRESERERERESVCNNYFVVLSNKHIKMG